MSPVEKQIVQLFKEGDSRAIDLLYDNYADTLYGVVYKMVRDEAQAQDIIQDAFVKVWKRSKLYDPSKGRLFTWLMSIVRNQAIDAIRKNKRGGEIYGESGDVLIKLTPADTRDVSVKYDLTKVLAELDVTHRQLLEHSYILGYTHPEIAKKFDIPLGTVKTRIRNAMRELRSIFGNGRQ